MSVLLLATGIPSSAEAPAVYTNLVIPTTAGSWGVPADIYSLADPYNATIAPVLFKAHQAYLATPQPDAFHVTLISVVYPLASPGDAIVDVATILSHFDRLPVEIKQACLQSNVMWGGAVNRILGTHPEGEVSNEDAGKLIDEVVAALGIH